jgi:hypothetical protein
MTNLQPTNVITYPLNWEAKSIDITVNAFPLFPDTVEVFWKIIGNLSSFSGSTTIPNEVVSEWGTDDSVIQTYILQQLGLLEAPVVVEEPIVVEENVVIEEVPAEEQTTSDETIV